MAKIPESIDKYKVEALIAQGGMGAVYKALHPTLKRPVIIKKLTLRGSADIAERFKREARILMDFRHEGVVDMYDHFKLGQSYYIVLEYVDGGSLEEVVKKHRYLENGVAAYILYHAAVALHYAHEKKVVHRDIKPANLLLSRAGEVKLVDFGIAVSDTDSDEGLTREGMTLGTPSYMAPEQFQNTKNVDRRADIYSLGVLAYEMLTGKKPFPGGFSPELIANIQKGRYPSPRKFNPNIHPVLARFIKKAMKAKAERRFKDLAPMIKLLGRFLKGYDRDELTAIVADIAAGKEPVKPKLVKKRWYPLRWVAGLAAGLLLAAAGVLCSLTGFHNEILRAKSYGAVILSVEVPRGNQPPGKIYIQADLFVDDDQDIPDFSDGRFLFRREKGEEERWYRYRSLPVYLPRGAYRAKIQAEDRLTWHSFIVEPRDRQKQSPATERGLVIRAGTRATGPQPLNVKVEVSNILTGRVLERDVLAEVFWKGSWIPLAEAEEMTTGGVYNFRIGHPDYSAKIFSLRIGEEQKALDLKAALVPKPGMLSLSREKEGILLSLDGSERIFSAEAVPVSVDLNENPELSVPLAPGEYELDLRYRGKEQHRTITLVKDETLSLSVSVDPDSGDLLLREE